MSLSVCLIQVCVYVNVQLSVDWGNESVTVGMSSTTHWYIWKKEEENVLSFYKLKQLHLTGIWRSQNGVTHKSLIVHALKRYGS